MSSVRGWHRDGPDNGPAWDPDGPTWRTVHAHRVKVGMAMGAMSALRHTGPARVSSVEGARRLIRAVFGIVE